MHTGTIEHEATVDAQVETSLAFSISAETEKEMVQPRNKNDSTTFSANVTVTLVASVLWLLSYIFKAKIIEHSI